jgi:hypothetical protein
MSKIDKRMFYLMLSAIEGQDFAKAMGFSPPSQDVIEVETEEILTRWAVFLHYGLLKEIDEASKWFADFLKQTDRINSDIDDFKSILTVYGVALLNKIMESEKLAFVVGDEDE